MTVRVPRDARLRVVVSSGDVHLSGLDGRVAIDSASGDVHAATST